MASKSQDKCKGRTIWSLPREREFFIDNLLVRIHFIIVMVRWTGLAPWEFEFPFSGSLTSTEVIKPVHVLIKPVHGITQPTHIYVHVYTYLYVYRYVYIHRTDFISVVKISRVAFAATADLPPLGTYLRKRVLKLVFLSQFPYKYVNLCGE